MVPQLSSSNMIRPLIGTICEVSQLRGSSLWVVGRVLLDGKRSSAASIGRMSPS